MLNYKFAMRQFLIGVPAALIILVQSPFSAALLQDPDSPSIESPLQGQAVQGSVPIRGSVPADNFDFAELAFRYDDDPTGTLFPLAHLDQPVGDGLLADWDTASITDGNYSLQLIVFYIDGSQAEASVSGIRVRNYTAIETSTPAPTEAPPSPESAAGTAAATPIPKTPTPLPDNPARVTSSNITASLFRGLTAVLVVFGVFGLYLGLRALIRR